MNDNPVPPLEEEKKSNLPLILGIGAIVLCCCIVVAGASAWWLWNNGDELMGISQQFILATI